MHSIQQRFAQLEQLYPQLLHEVHSSNTRLSYAGFDYFSFEPYVAQLQHYDTKQCECVEQLADIEGPMVMQVLIANNRVIFSREFCGETAYYDSFFIYQGSEKYRYQIYKNGDEVRAVYVEKLVLDLSDMPVSFERIDNLGQLKREYLFQQKGCAIHSHYFASQTGTPREETWLVQYNAFATEVAKIMDATHQQTLFDAQCLHASMAQLCALAHKKIIHDVLTGLQQISTPNEPVVALILEYNSDFAIPPSIALTLQSEREQLSKENHPIAWIDAQSMSLFYQCSFFAAQDPLYIELSDRFNAIESSTRQKRIFEFYVALAKELNNSIKQLSNLVMSADFQVYARDFAYSNEWQFLQALLPEAKFVQLSADVEAYESELAAQIWSASALPFYGKK